MITMKLDGLRVAVLIADGFEQIEMTRPVEALRAAGAQVDIISPADGEVQGVNGMEKGDRFTVDVPLDDARPEDYEALLLPGGVKNPDILRQQPKAVEMVRHLYENAKPIAAICHAPWLLVEADVVRGRRLTSYPSLRTDIRNAGGEWTDAECVVDQGLVTSRRPDDLPAFIDKMLEEFAEGEHGKRFVGAATGSQHAGS
jgi:protease I